MTKREDVLEQVRKVVADVGGPLKLEDVTEGADWRKKLGLDSLDLVEIVMELEEHYDISIDDDEFEKKLGESWTAGKATDYIMEKLK